LVFLIAQGTAVVLLPYAFTHWQPGTPPWPVAVRAIGVALIVAGGIMVIWGFVRFATEGAGIPVPTEPTSRQLTVGGPYRYLRNPLYLAIALVISGQGLLLSRPVLVYAAAVLLAAFVVFVHWYEEPSLARRFGEQYDTYCSQVPAGGPVCHAAGPDALVTVAEDKGFEPLRGCPQHAFQVCGRAFAAGQNRL
jgi:protein-S-isoprenylcysteine O-methyltransferase Ste14